MAEATQDVMTGEVTEPGEKGKSKSGGEDEQKVPYHRFEEVIAARREAEDKLEELQQRVLDFEDRDKSETERAKARAERAEQQLQQLQTTVTGLQKGAWVRSAAAELNFHDPEDAVTYLQGKLAGLEDEREAKRIVKNLASQKKHLVREERQEERPNLQRVFGGSQAEQANGGGQRQQLTPAQAAARQEIQFAEGLAGELGKFRERWKEMPSGFGGMGG